MDTLVCFHCHGAGTSFVHINARPQCYWTWLRCDTWDNKTAAGTVAAFAALEG